jgi:hypothetical protein
LLFAVRFLQHYRAHFTANRLHWRAGNGFFVPLRRAKVLVLQI